MEPSRWSRTVTITAVLMPASIAAVMSYSHMYELALRHGEPPVESGPVPALGGRHDRGCLHAWPSFALIGAYELLIREFRTVAQGVRPAPADDEQDSAEATGAESVDVQGRTVSEVTEASGLQVVNDVGGVGNGKALTPFRAWIWEWALERERGTGKLPTGAQIAECSYRKERWGGW